MEAGVFVRDSVTGATSTGWLFVPPRVDKLLLFLFFTDTIIMGKITAAADNLKYKYHKEAAEHGPSDSKAEHAKDAAKYKAKEKVEKHT